MFGDKVIKTRSFGLKQARHAVENVLEPQSGVNGERLAPMATAKNVLAEKLKIFEADKIAIRPSYEKYRYETAADDNVYDDEYDDGYEQRELKVEPLNAQSTLEESGEEESRGTQRGPALSAGKTHTRIWRRRITTYGRGATGGQKSGTVGSSAALATSLSRRHQRS